MLLALIARFHSCTTISETTLQDHKKEIMQVVDITCKQCVVLGPVRAEGNKVALSVINPIGKRIRHQILLMDFDSMESALILSPKLLD